MDTGLEHFLYNHTLHSNHWTSMRSGTFISRRKIIPATTGVKEEIYHDQK